MTTITYSTQLVAETCCSCGIPFGMPADFKAQRLEDHRSWYCPNGHSQHYIAETEAEKLKRQLGYANARAESWKDQAETAEHRRRGQKAATTRLKRRIAAGVCPCCNRSFVDLGRHMAGQHPTFVEVPGTAESSGR